MKKLVLALFAAALSLPAQTSSLQGVITDAQGAAVPDAIVTARNLSTSAERRTLSSGLGEYSLLQLPPGGYTVTIEKPGFKTHKGDIVLQVNTPASISVQLELGQVTGVVNVSAEVSTVNTENAAVGSPFNETQVKEIPLQTRNVVALLSVQAGVAPTGQVVGARPDQNNVLLDGVDVNDNFGADGFNSVIPIPLDSVQEFRTTIAGLGADMGHSAGGQVSVVTKGGSNQFHGSAYEYNRNTLTSANNWFSNRSGVPRAALVRNQYGASLGGPILKNKLFFFYNFEGRKDRSATQQSRTVPTDTFQQGIVRVLLKDGRTVQLTPQDVAAIDPLHVGASSYVMSLMKQYPAGNNPQAASDKGLNFNVLTFNAPNGLDNHAQVGRLDYNIDSAGKHTLMFRGTLNGAAHDGTGTTTISNLAQLPGQAAASRTLDNSRGLAGRYTAVLSPHVVNVLTYGYTRLGTASTGNQTVLPKFFFDTLAPTARASTRVAPTTNAADDLTWTKGRHTMQFGVNLRYMENDKLTYNNVANYSFSRNTLLGLGGDITADVLAYLQPTYGSGIALASGTNVTNAFGTLLGLINQFGATYHYGIDGSVIPFGTPVTTAFATSEYEGYAQDTFKWKRNFTITYGLRYSLYKVPYEVNGVEVMPTVPLSVGFAERVGGQALGIPGWSLPNAMTTYDVAGPLHNKPGYYPLDKKDFAPRLSIAWSPASGTLAEKILGKGSVIRAGAGMIFDHYGSAMMASFASSGSPGLASTVAQPVNTNFTTGFRYGGSGLPVLPTVQGGSFPYTPPAIQGGFNSFSAVANDLKAPYEHVMNISYSRPLPKKLSVEVGYAGRLAHRGIVQQDFGQPLTLFKDTKSGQTWAQASLAMAQLYNSGLTPAQVKANPGLVPNQAFFENIFPGAKNLYITGSASANYYYDLINNYADSDLDTLNDMDRIRQPNGGCISIYGCNTFYPLQDSGVLAYVNAGKSAYHAGTLVIRRAVTNGWGFDFNYTLSHSLDNGSASETSGGAALQDSFNPNAYRGPSDFDMRHNITADAVVELPFGKGKPLMSHVPGWVNQIVGGWQVSTLLSYHTGVPLNLSNGGVYNVNYLYSALAILKPGGSLPGSGFSFDQNGAPSIFQNTSAVNSFIGGYPGQVGSRGIVRGPGFFNNDMSLSKWFSLPKEGHKIQLRAEAFNAFNNVQWNNPGTTNLSLATPTTFGEITSAGTATLPARVMQFALRYQF
jgi:hypothetical protein